MIRARMEAPLRTRRRRRAVKRGLAVAVGVVVGVASGACLGFQSHSSARDLARREALRRQHDRDDLAEQRRVLLQELWKMEAVERAPGFVR